MLPCPDILIISCALVTADPGLVSLRKILAMVVDSILPAGLTRTRRPIMYMLAPKLEKSMTLNAGTMNLPRA